MEIELPDGTILEAPDDADASKIAKHYLASKAFNTETPTNPNAIKPGSWQAKQASHATRPNWASGVASVGPAGPDASIAQRAQEIQNLSTHQAQQIKKQAGHDIRGVVWNRPENQEVIRDVGLSAATAIATGGASGPVTLGRLGWQALAQGGAGATSEAVGQMQEGGITDPGQIAKEGAYTAAGDLAGGTILKTAGKLANKLFVTPMDEPTGRAAQFARESGAKFPLSSAMPGSRPAMAQGASNALLPGQLRNISDAKQVATFLNREIGNMQQDPIVIKAAADSGQKFLRTVFEPGETVYTKTFENYRQLVGDDTPVPLTASVKAIQSAAQDALNRGESGPIAKRLIEMSGIEKATKNKEAADKIAAQITDYRAKLKVLEAGRTPKNTARIDADMDRWEGKIVEAKRLLAEKAAPVGMPDSLTAKQADELYTGILKQAAKDPTSRGEMGKVLQALESDLDETGKLYGANFADDAKLMKDTRDQWRDLRKVEGLSRLSKELGSQGGARDHKEWLDGLFVNPNGKALAKFRELQPELYHDVADAWLGKELNRFSRSTDGAIGKTLDGRALRTWYGANSDRIKLIYGAPQAQALDNFSLYAQYMASAAKKGDQGFPGLNDFGALARVGTEGAAIAKAPFITIPSQGAAFLLARGLSDPKSQLFKLMTQGFDPKTRQFMLMTGQMGGRETGRAAAN